MTKKLKQLINWLNWIGGIDDYFEIDEIDRHIAKFGIDNPSLNKPTLNTDV